MRSLVVLALALAACNPSTATVACKGTFLPGDLVITEVFADYAAPTGGNGSDAAQEWFEIYNNTDGPAELEGLTLVHSRPDGSSSQSHTMHEIAIASRQYLTLGNAANELVSAFVDYGYGTDLGDLYNTDGGKLALECGSTEVDSALYTDVKAGHSRELTSALPPDYTLNDDQANWCQANATEFEAGNFGTPGQSNDCQPIIMGVCNDAGSMRNVVSPGIGDLVITEVMPSPAAVSDTVGEWFEAKAMMDMDLNGVGLDRAADASAPNVISSPDCIHVAAGTFVVFARSPDTTVDGGIPSGTVLGTFTFSLVAGSTSAPGDVEIVAGGSTVDAITWTSSRSGTSLQLDPGLTDTLSNDAPTNFCDGTTPYGLGDLGTPSLMNDPCPLLPPPGMCDDNGTPRAIVKPAAGALVISEIMPNPKIEPGQEWFEITNTSASAFDVNELGLDRAGDTRMPDIIHSAACVAVAPGGFGLFARSSDPTINGMLPAVDATFGFTMINTGSGDVRVLDGDTVLDAVSWTSSTDGVSSQVEPTHLTTTDNDASASFCAAITTYGDGTNKGTPKAANTCM